MTVQTTVQLLQNIQELLFMQGVALLGATVPKLSEIPWTMFRVRISFICLYYK